MMLKTAGIFVLIGVLPLLFVLGRLRKQETDNELQQMIRETTKKIQMRIAGIFITAAFVMAIGHFTITDQNTANMLIIAVYSLVIVTSSLYAVIGQFKLQAKIRQLTKE